MHVLLSTAALMLTSASPNMNHPITLNVTERDGAAELMVIGRAGEPVRATYRLEVESGTSGNRSAQSGQAELVPGREVSLVHLVLAGSGAAHWQARLTVEPEGGPAYEEVAKAPTESAK